MWYNVAPMATTETEKPHVLRVRVSENEKRWLEKFARQDDRSTHYVLRQAVSEFIDRHGPEVLGGRR